MTTDTRPSAVNDLADRFWAGVLELAPLSATVFGVEEYDDRLPDPGPAGRDRTRALTTSTIAEAAAIPEDGLSIEERITRDMVRVASEIQLEELDERFDIFGAVDQMHGPQTVLPDAANVQRVDTPERLDRFIARLHAYPAFVAAVGDLAREGIATGLTQPRIIVERVIGQLERLLAVPIEDHPVVSTAKVTSTADRDRIAASVERVVRPAEAEYLELVRREYLPAARDVPGLWSVPDGDRFYRTQVRAWTTLDLDPRDVHRIGLEALESIEAERRAIARAAGFGDDTDGFRRAMRSDPADIPTEREQVVWRAYEDIDRAMAAAPRYFGRLPMAACEVKPVEPYKEADAPFAYYMPPSAGGVRPGTYWVNTYDLPSRTFSSLASTTYHEAVPGHHFQIALEQELEDLPDFRRYGSRMVGGAFAEGWGLYVERLADEMGLYRNDYERFGMLDAQAWRAGRLIVDTGMHALRWSRQQSIDLLLSAGLTQTNAVIETDRYIMWPGQALTYMIGQREIARLRAELERRDGAAFDLRTFHDATIGHGSLPLATLARELPRWVGPAGG